MTNTLPSCIRYKILKPNIAISSHHQSFHQMENQDYELSMQTDQPIRKYKLSYESLDYMLHLSEWRFNMVNHVIKCLFVQLQKPKKEVNTFQCQIYTEHFQVLLRDMSTLILQESFYLILQSLKGLKQLLTTFSKVTISMETIGLIANGSCKVWINRNLGSLASESQHVTSENEAIQSVISIIKQKSEHQSQVILSKIIDFTNKKKPNIQNVIGYLTKLASQLKIKIPLNLKYLVNQQKIAKSFQKLKVHEPIRFVHHKNLDIEEREIKSHRYCPDSEAKENYVNPNHKSYQKCKRLSDNHVNSQFRATSSFQSSNHFFTQKLLNSKFDQKLIDLGSNLKSRKPSFLNSLNRSSPRTENCNKLSMSHSKRTFSKKKNYNNSVNITNINVISGEKSEKNKESHLSRNRQSHHPRNKFIGISKPSDPSDRGTSLKERQKPKISTSRVYKSFVDEFKNQMKGKSIGEQCQEHESSPKRDNYTKHPMEYKKIIMKQIENFDRLQPESRVEEVIKANQWKINLQTEHLWKLEGNLNTSVTISQQRNIYLQSVKLQKLDLLSNCMFASLIPSGEIEYPK